MSSIKRFIKYLANSFTRKKPLVSSQAITTELTRCLSTLDLTFIGIGSTVGAGIYVLTGDVAKNKAGPAIVLSFLIAAVASLLSGFCYAEFGARVPKAGSAYLYCYITIGELCGFFIGWNMLLEYIIGGASIARGLSAYIDSLAHGQIQKGTIFLIGDINVPYLSKYFDIFSLILVLFFTVFLSLGVKNSARLNNACVLVNILTILLVIFVGCGYVETKNWSNFAPYGASGVFSGAATCFFSFIGFDVIATTSEEARNPAFSVPVSMTATIIICFIAYFGVSSVITLMVPYTLLDENAAVANAFHQRGFNAMGHIIGIGATLGLSGCTLISMLPLPRMMYALAKDGMIFKIFSKVNEDTGVPVIATFTSGVLIGILAMILDLSSLVEMLSIGTLSAYTIVDICVIILRYRIHPFVDDNSNGDNQNEIRSAKEIKSVTEVTSLLGKETIDKRHGSVYYKNMVLYLVVVWILIASFLLSVLLLVYSSDLNVYVIVIMGVLGCSILSSCVYLSFCKQNNVNLSFKAPLVPWLPVLAIVSNAYLMVSLSQATWIRLAVWVALGTIVYFGYSIRHSIERE